MFGLIINAKQSGLPASRLMREVYFLVLLKLGVACNLFSASEMLRSDIHHLQAEGLDSKPGALPAHLGSHSLCLGGDR